MSDIITTRYADLEVFQHDAVICKSLVMYGEWAQNELEVISSFIPKGGDVIDAGAFIGTHALAFSSFVGPHGKIHAFEPRKQSYKVLCRNVRHNSCANIEIYNLGLGKSKNCISVEAADSSQCKNFGSLALTNQTTDNVDPEVVQIRSLDSFNFERINFIKLDVEGMEADVLEGALDSIKRSRPIMFAEINSLEDGLPVFNFRRRIDYRTFAVLTSAYSENNFNNESKNIFGNAKELGLLLLPQEKVACYRDRLAKLKLPEISRADELALMLYNKPQYPFEQLATSPLAKSFSIHGYEYDRYKQSKVKFDRTVADLDNIIHDLERSLKEKELLLSSKEKTLEHRTDELYSVYISKSWRYTLPLRKAGSLIRKVSCSMHKPRLRALIKSAYFKLPPSVRNSRLVDRLKYKFKSREAA